jgi:hypothetical protein
MLCARGALIERGVTTMNPIAVFLTVACLAVGAVGATGHLYAGIPVVIAAIVIASALKMATVPRRR